MKNLINLFAIIAASVAVFSASAFAQEAADDRDIYIIYDSSNSMWGALDDGARKYEAADTALNNFLKTDFGARELAFRIYGKNVADDCSDSELVVPFSTADDAKSAIGDAMSDTRPKGRTPIDRSLRAALSDIGDRKSDIILITDGVESCDADPCALMEEWRDKDVGIRVHVVGLGLDEMGKAAMTCIAETSGAKYYDAASSDELAEGLSEAGDAVLVEIEGEPDPAPQALGYALKIKAADAEGRSFIVKGELLKDGEPVKEVVSHGRNVIDEPGDYEIEVGPVLQDGSIYKPVRVPVEITEPGETTVEVEVTRPSILSARFVEEGEEVRGSLVTASQDGEEAFSFRAFDEVLVRPGAYEFKASPNQDNELTLSETLVEGEHTVLVFDMTKTVRFSIVYKLPNGEIVKRGSELWRDGEKIYRVFSGNPTTARPGVYELRADNDAAPLKPVEIEILPEDGKTYEIPLDVGWLEVVYTPSEYYWREPDRYNVESLERKKTVFGRISKSKMLAPGQYRVHPQSSASNFQPKDVEIVSGETATVTFEAAPMGWIIVNYAPSENYSKEPDRASIYPLDGQKYAGPILRPGEPRLAPPGRYKVEPWSYAGDIDPIEATIVEGETVEVTFRLKGE